MKNLGNEALLVRYHFVTIYKFAPQKRLHYYAHILVSKVNVNLLYIFFKKTLEHYQKKMINLFALKI